MQFDPKKRRDLVIGIFLIFIGLIALGYFLVFGIIEALIPTITLFSIGIYLIVFAFKWYFKVYGAHYARTIAKSRGHNMFPTRAKEGSRQQERRIGREKGGKS